MIETTGGRVEPPRCHSLTARVLAGDDRFMHRFAWIALGCFASGVIFAACSDGENGTTSSSSTGSSSGTGGMGGAGGTEASSSTGSTSGSAGSGAGGCTVVEQCAASGPCKTVACQNGACVEDLAPAGTTVTTAATTGDCKRRECDAAGNVVETVDDNDKPVDYNSCTFDLCTNGVPSNPVDASKEGMSCGTGQAKCAAGKCSGCNSNGNCPSGAVCDEPVCDAQKVCGFVVDVGKLVSNANPSDCFVKQCDAKGDVINAAAPGETPPPDANECDIEVCGSNGVEHSSVPDGTMCGGSTQCHPRTCMSAMCADGPLPGNETTTSNQMAGDCKTEVCDGAGGVVQINDDTDIPTDPNPNDCTIVKCTNGVPGTGSAPAGTMCTQPNMLPGTCSITGVCS
jgi:hypothetical protein